MIRDGSRNRFLFPKWTNLLRPGIVIAAVGGLVYVTVIVTFGFSPKTINVGYKPQQPVPFSHRLHAGELGMDCRYCHNTVERTARAAIPPTQTCMNCHASVRTKSEKLTPVFQSYATGMPVEWVRVHDLPDYVYFNHSIHVDRGVPCVACHGRIDTMDEVRQVQPLSMGWCLDCHRAPEKYLRPPALVTKMDWQPDGDQMALGRQLRKTYHINPSTDCITCHR
jgi:menaquinone reductase, multiheme cytochrome c subunit